MTHQWDEFSKSLAEECVPRRESLRRLGAAFAGAALMPFSWALGAPKAGGQDPCKTFCNRCSKKQQSQCLAACQACGGNTSRLCGTCGNYACCGNDMACCGGACVDMFDDFYNCGGCGLACDPPGPYEDGACVDGTCLYQCVPGATRCNGTCTLLGSDSANCGTCGNVCADPGPNEYGGCVNGTCAYDCYEGATRCDGTCTDVSWDPDNCGACGNVCGGATPYCSNGACTDCGWGGAICNGVCIDVLFDANNCGACGFQCQPLDHCSWGVCEGSCIGCE